MTSRFGGVRSIQLSYGTGVFDDLFAAVITPPAKIFKPFPETRSQCQQASLSLSLSHCGLQAHLLDAASRPSFEPEITVTAFRATHYVTTLSPQA